MMMESLSDGLMKINRCHDNETNNDEYVSRGEKYLNRAEEYKNELNLSSDSSSENFSIIRKDGIWPIRLNMHIHAI